MISMSDRLQLGEELRDGGMARAVESNEWLILRGELLFLQALLKSPNGCATIDAATEPRYLGTKFERGGKWRGVVTRRPAEYAIISKLRDSTGRVASRQSTRPPRHGAYVCERKLVDRVKAERRVEHLAELIRQYDEDRPRDLFGDPL